MLREGIGKRRIQIGSPILYLITHSYLGAIIGFMSVLTVLVGSVLRLAQDE